MRELFENPLLAMWLVAAGIGALFSVGAVAAEHMKDAQRREFMTACVAKSAPGECAKARHDAGGR